MFDSQQFLTIAAFTKWVRGEPVSIEDLDRIIKVIESAPLSVSAPDPQTAKGIEVRLRQALHKNFGGPKQ